MIGDRNSLPIKASKDKEKNDFYILVMEQQQNK